MRIVWVLVALLFCNIVVKAEPVVLFHGMGDQCKNEGMNGFTELIGKELGAYSVCIEVGNGAMTSLFHNISDQAKQACEKLSQDPRLQTNISVIGLSQGSLIGRWVIQNCPQFKGTVTKYLSIGGPQMGVARIPGCFHGKICNVVSWFVNGLVYSPVVQKLVGPAGYFHNYKHEAKYRHKSVLLPYLNNELQPSQQGYKKLLNTHTMLVMFDKDSMIYPKQSSWFQFFDQTGHLLGFFDTPHYREDLLPLREMYINKKLTFIRIDGDHLQFSKDDIFNTFLPFLRGQAVQGEDISTEKATLKDE